MPFPFGAGLYAVVLATLRAAAPIPNGILQIKLSLRSARFPFIHTDAFGIGRG